MRNHVESGVRDDGPGTEPITEICVRLSTDPRVCVPVHHFKDHYPLCVRVCGHQLWPGNLGDNINKLLLLLARDLFLLLLHLDERPVHENHEE